jgi:hypothetical protein
VSYCLDKLHFSWKRPISEEEIKPASQPRKQKKSRIPEEERILYVMEGKRITQKNVSYDLYK